ncbi:MAG: hypothetical protein RL318_2679 [Fibrobacterota bacterium]
MTTLLEWLDLAPRETPTELHEAHCVREGIYSKARIQEELMRWALDPVRLDKLEPLLRRSLELVALRGAAGLRLSHLHRILGLQDIQVHHLADRLRDGLWCAMERDEDGLILRVFEEYRLPLLKGRLDAVSIPDATSPPLSWHWRFLQGTTALFARIILGKVRTNRDGSLNRRDSQALAEGYSMLLPLGEQAPVDAARLALTWLSREGHIRCGNGRLDLTASIPTLLESFSHEIQAWWQSRFPNALELGELWSEDWLEGKEASLWFGAEPQESSPLWHQLPENLRLGILCGILEPCVRDLRLVAIRRNTPTPPPADTPRITPDHTLLLPPGTGLRDWFFAHLLASREDVELYARFRLERDTWLAGISTTSLEEAQNWITTLAPPDNVRQSLQSWTEARTLCSLRSVTLLQVRDPRRQRELASLPQLAGFLREEIPGWGFVVDSREEASLRESLAKLGYEPPPLREEEVQWREIDSVPGMEVTEPSVATSQADPVWPKPERPEMQDKHSTRTRFSGELRELPPSELGPLLDYAVVVDAPLELTIKGAPRKLLYLWPERVDKRKTPILLRARNADGAVREIAIDTIRQIRLVDE